MSYFVVDLSVLRRSLPQSCCWDHCKRVGRTNYSFLRCLHGNRKTCWSTRLEPSSSKLCQHNFWCEYVHSFLFDTASSLPACLERLIGRAFNDSVVQSDMKHWPFRVIADSAGKPQIQLQFRGETQVFSPEVSAFRGCIIFHFSFLF